MPLALHKHDGESPVIKRRSTKATSPALGVTMFQMGQQQQWKLALTRIVLLRNNPTPPCLLPAFDPVPRFIHSTCNRGSSFRINGHTWRSAKCSISYWRYRHCLLPYQTMSVTFDMGWHGWIMAAGVRPSEPPGSRHGFHTISFHRGLIEQFRLSSLGQRFLLFRLLHSSSCFALFHFLYMFDPRRMYSSSQLVPPQPQKV